MFQKEETRMRYICLVCGYVYDEAVEKALFGTLPDDWKCPLCGAARSDFRPEKQQEPAEANTSVPLSSSYDEDTDQPYSPGQLSAICSNLARGCEKQYKQEEAALFRELSDYFRSAVPAASNAGVQMIAGILQDDIERYASVRAAAVSENDRGAQRVCVWGEKVTRVLANTVGRYLREGEAMLEDTDIWVCTVCGFVWVSDQAPEMCPVCKVPSWKFEKIGRSAVR